MFETRDIIEASRTIRLDRGSAAEACAAGIARLVDRPVPLIAFNRSQAPTASEPDRDRGSVAPAEPDPARALTAREKAAFTLRLDPARHERLRQACATKQRSAQQIVTEALDAFLAATSGPAFAPRTGAAFGGF